MDAAFMQMGSSLVQSMLNTGLALYQDKLNYNRFLENRDYNTPFNQMQRLEEAGINPNASAESVAGHSVSSDAPPMSPPFSQFQTSDLGSAMAAQAQYDLSKAQADYYRSLTTGIDIENAFKPYIIKENLSKAKKDNRLSDLTIEFTEKNNSVLYDINLASLNKMQADTKEVDARTAKTWAEKDLVLQNIKVAKSVEELNAALKVYNYALVTKSGAETDKIKSEDKFIQQQTKTEEFLTDKAEYDALSAERDAAIKFVEAYFATEEMNIYKDMGWTPGMEDVYTRYKSIEKSKGKYAADKFLDEIFYITGENENVINQMKFYWSESQSKNPVMQVGAEGRRTQAAAERGARSLKHSRR